MAGKPKPNPQTKYYRPPFGREPEISDGTLAPTKSEKQTWRRYGRRMILDREASSRNSFANLLQLIKKLPAESQKSIIEKLKSAREMPGGRPSYRDRNDIGDLPF